MSRSFRKLRSAVMLALFTAVACDGSYVEEVSSPVASALSCEPKVVVYGSEGAALRQYALDLATGQLAAGASVGFPVTVQYVAVDRKSEHLYVSVSNGALSPELFAFDIDGASGALTPRGASLVPAGGRIINLSVNHQGTHLGLAHNVTNQAATVALARRWIAGRRGGAGGAGDDRSVPHQAKFDHAGHNLIVPGLALNGGDGTLTVFRVEQGQLTKTQTLTLAPGLGARHVDFDRTGRFVYAAIERGNRLYTYRFSGGQLSPLPLFDQSTLADPANNAIARQRAGAIHVHPNKRFLYLSNRQDTLDARRRRCRARTTSRCLPSTPPPAGRRCSSTSTPGASRPAASPSIPRGAI